MYYRDEFGLEINLPKRPSESAIEAIRNSRATLIEMLSIFEKRSTNRNTCMNPVMKREETDGN